MNKISNLGKLLLIFIFVPIMMFANVHASLDKIAVLKGDTATYTISASGNNIEFPRLSNIEGHPVVGTSTSTSINIINGNMKKIKKVSYTFAPKYTFTIPNYSIIVDGKEEQTEPIKIKVIKPTASTSNDDLQLFLKIDKTEAYVGEALKATIVFKYKVGIDIIDIALEDFKIKHFFLKTLDQTKPYEENGFIVLKQSYLLFPQLAGDYTIDKQLINVAIREYRTNMKRWTKVYSKELNLKIKPLPSNLSIQGDYTISASVDKLQTKANDPINLTLTIKGSGNIDDIEPFKVDIPQAITYSDKPQVQTMLEHNIYKGVFKQKIALISDSNFTIPSLSFSFYSKKDKKIVVKTTKPIDIEVVGSPKNPVSNNSQKNIQLSDELKTNSTNTTTPAMVTSSKLNSTNSYILFFIGVLFGIVATLIVLKVKNKPTKKQIPIIKQIKKYKNNNKELFKLLLPYKGEDSSIDTILEDLEQNIYKNVNNKIDISKVVEYFYWKS